jgi:hypothetical protein
MLWDLTERVKPAAPSEAGSREGFSAGPIAELLDALGLTVLDACGWLLGIGTASRIVFHLLSFLAG